MGGWELPPAPLRVFAPLLREGERSLWPGKAGSTAVLSKPLTPKSGPTATATALVAQIADANKRK